MTEYCGGATQLGLEAAYIVGSAAAGCTRLTYKKSSFFSECEISI